MRYINIEVANEYVKGAGVPIGAAGSYSDVALKIRFSDMWDGMAKHITWLDANGENPTIVYLTGTQYDGECWIVPIPVEAKAVAGTAVMSIKGADENKGTLTAKAEFKVLESVYDPDAEESEDPTPTVAEQLQTEIETILGSISGAAQSAENAAASEAAAALSESAAADYATRAKSYAVGGTNSRTGEDTDNAKYYKEQAESAAEQAIAVVGVAPATALPLADGTAAVGTSGKYAREDHVHPKSSDDFIAVYGTTTYSQINTVYVAQNKKIYVHLGYELVPFFEEKQFFLYDSTSETYTTAFVFKSDRFVATVDSNDQWSIIEMCSGLAVMQYPGAGAYAGAFQSVRIACALGLGVVLVRESSDVGDEPDANPMWFLYGSNSDSAEDDPATAFWFLNISSVTGSEVRVNSVSLTSGGIIAVSSPKLITSSWLNRSNAVDSANGSDVSNNAIRQYYMARGEAVAETDTTPSNNGAICWTLG